MHQFKVVRRKNALWWTNSCEHSFQTLLSVCFQRSSIRSFPFSRNGKKLKKEKKKSVGIEIQEHVVHLYFKYLCLFTRKEEFCVTKLNFKDFKMYSWCTFDVWIWNVKYICKAAWKSSLWKTWGSTSVPGTMWSWIHPIIERTLERLRVYVEDWEFDPSILQMRRHYAKLLSWCAAETPEIASEFEVLLENS